MYTHRFGKVTQRLSIVHTPIVFSQATQTQITCPVTKAVSFHVSPTSSLTSSSEVHPAKSCQMKSTQTVLNLNPTDSKLELRILNVTHRVIDPTMTRHKAVQTSEGSHTSETMATKLLPSTIPDHVTTSKQLPSSNAGISNDDVMGGERRKRDELLAKLRAMDGTKNPPESQPIESAAARTSIDNQKQPFQSGVGVSDSKQSVVESHSGQLEAANKPTVSNQQLSKGLWSKGETTNGQTPSNNLLQRSPLFQSESTGRGDSSGAKPPRRGPLSPSSTLRSTPLQNSGNRTGVESLLLGESQPFQATSLTLHASRGSQRNQPVNSPEHPDPLITSSPHGGSTQPHSLFGPNSVNTNPQSSLFNLTGGQMTKASTDLSTLMVQGRRATSPMRTDSASLLQDEGRRATAPLNIAKKFEASEIRSKPVNRQNRAGVFKSPHSRASSNSSLQSWPDTVQNMHIGKPAYATESDPLGRKHSTRNSKPSNEYKPMHGRRAGTLEEIPDNLGSISENHPGSTAHQKHDIKPRSDSQSYPWEVAIDVQEQELDVQRTSDSHKRSSNHRETSASSRLPLLPLRPKQNGSTGGLGMMSGPATTYVAEPDDLEQVIL